MPLLLDLSNQKINMSRLLDMTIHIPLFLSVNQYQFMACWLRPVALSQTTIQQGIGSLCSSLAILCGTDPVSGLTLALYVAVFSIISVFFGGGDLALTGV